MNAQEKWLEGIVGADRRHWEGLFRKHGFAAVVAAFKDADDQQAKRPDTYHAIPAAAWDDDFYSHLNRETK